MGKVVDAYKEIHTGNRGQAHNESSVETSFGEEEFEASRSGNLRDICGSTCLTSRGLTLYCFGKLVFSSVGSVSVNVVQHFDDDTSFRMLKNKQKIDIPMKSIQQAG